MHKNLSTRTRPTAFGCADFVKGCLHAHRLTCSQHKERRRHHFKKSDICAKNYDKVKIISIIDDLR